MDMIVDASPSTRREYAARMNRVVDYIQDHLADPLNLEQLAQIACFRFVPKQAADLLNSLDNAIPMKGAERIQCAEDKKDQSALENIRLVERLLHLEIYRNISSSPIGKQRVAERAKSQINTVMLVRALLF